MPNDTVSARTSDAAVAQRALRAGELPAHSADLALLLSDPAPEVRMAAARRCTDLAVLAEARRKEGDASVQLAIAATLGELLAQTDDRARALAVLEADACTDAIRGEVARRTQDSERLRIAIESIRDEDALAQLAIASGSLATRNAAAERLRVLAELRGLGPIPEIAKTPAPQARREVDRLAPYVPGTLQQHLATDPACRWWIAEGTAAVVDISGFTTLAERLARRGREGAEQITDVISDCFEAILAVAYEGGAALLKFGGDALLLWFHDEGHAPRACRAMLRMRRVLAEVGRIDLPDLALTLRMTQGVHTAPFHFFAVGSSHLELLTVGPAWTRLVEMQHASAADQITLSGETASLLPANCVGEANGPGWLLDAEPATIPEKVPLVRRPDLPADLLARCLSPGLRAHVLAGGGASEHRPVTIAFLRFEDTDALIAQQGAEAAADALDRLMSAVEAAVEARDVCFLASDIDANGGKLVLTAGAPKVTGDDEQRMLLAVERIAATPIPLTMRIGVHRGAVFAGDIGPEYRKTYTVMGDAVNLTARVMAKAGPGEVYVTREVLDRSETLFDGVEVEPFTVKGKSEPVSACLLGRARGSRTRESSGGESSTHKIALTGRNAELMVLRKVLGAARQGKGGLVEVVGQPGVGKTRLMEAVRDASAGFRKLRAACEAYTASIAYVAWAELLRQLLDVPRDAPDATVADRIRGEAERRAPDLLPWLPLVGAASGVQLPATPDVDMLAEKYRRAKLHETIVLFLEAMMPERTLIEIEDAQHMDEASAELLTYVAGKLGTRPWLVAVAHRPSSGGFNAPSLPTVTRLELRPLAAQDALRMAELASAQHPLPPHILQVIAQRSGGNPQFLRDLVRSVTESGGIGGLPDSAEAAAMALIDGLAPADRALVRRAAVLGNAFHPRMLAWFAEGAEPRPDADAWARLQDVFEEDGDGYLRFRHALLRDTAYEGLPYRSRRKLHGVVAARLEAELDHPEQDAAVLSLHYAMAGEHRAAWRYASTAAMRADAIYAYVEAAELYRRALESARRIGDLPIGEIASLQQALGDALYRANDFTKAAEAYNALRALAADDPANEVDVMLKLSHVEEKLGSYAEAVRWIDKARAILPKLPLADAQRRAARLAAWHATIMQAEGKTSEALERAAQAVDAAAAAGDEEALGDGYFVMAWAYGVRGNDGARALMQQALEAFQRAGNLVRQAQVLADLGVVCQWEGRWDEALSYYQQGREAALKVGSTVAATLARINMAEILTDRGEWHEARSLLEDTLPFWRASQYQYYLAACLWLLGRVLVRMSQPHEALVRLEESRAAFLRVGAEGEVPAVDGTIAECRIAMGDPDAALAIVNNLIGGGEPANGAARILPTLKRIEGHALLRQGDLWAARDALDASLAAARECGDRFGATLTMLSLVELDKLEGVEPPLELVDESRALLAQFKIRAVPPVPAPA